MTAEEIAARRNELGPVYTRAVEDARANLRAELLGAAVPEHVMQLALAFTATAMALSEIDDLKPDGEADG